MNFKEFIVSEGLDLSNMGSSIDRVFAGNRQFHKHTGQVLSGQVQMPQIPMPENGPEVPKMERTGKVAVLLNKRNPIYLKLTDGTEAYLTYDEWNRLKEKPSVGNTVSITFQRHYGYQGPNQSKIEQIIVRE